MQEKAAAVLQEIKEQQIGKLHQNGSHPSALTNVKLKGRVFQLGSHKTKQARRHLHNAAELLDSPIKTFYYFRHWFTTQALLQGIDIRTLAGVLGHQDGGALLLRTYGHLCDKSAQDMAARLKF